MDGRGDPVMHRPHAGCSGFERRPLTRREVLWQAGGLGGIALGWLMGQEAARAGEPENPYAARAPHFPGKAKHVIQIFLCGGVSHVDTFDYKPELERMNGK